MSTRTVTSLVASTVLAISVLLTPTSTGAAVRVKRTGLPQAAVGQPTTSQRYIRIN